MANPSDGLKAKKNAEHFWKPQSQEVPLKRSIKAERAQDAAKTRKLRDLRLAKEQADKEEAEKIVAENPTQKPRSRKVTPSKPAKMRRMIY
jgi:hypothetical protein